MQVGFDAGDKQNFFSFPDSQTPAIIDVNNSSNVGVTGRWIFRIDQRSISFGAVCTGAVYIIVL